MSNQRLKYPMWWLCFCIIVTLVSFNLGKEAIAQSLYSNDSVLLSITFESPALCNAASNVQTALMAYEKSRIPPTTVIYDRSATMGYRSYQPDSETTLSEMMNSQKNQNDFQAWLYRYQPLSFA